MSDDWCFDQATEYEDDMLGMEYTPPEETNRRQRQRELEAINAAEREAKVLPTSCNFLVQLSGA